MGKCLVYDSRPISLRTEINSYNPPDKTSYVRISFGNSLSLCKLLYCFCLYSKYKLLLWVIGSILTYIYLLLLYSRKYGCNRVKTSLRAKSFIWIKMCFSSMFISVFIQINIIIFIFKWRLSHQDSFWNRSKREPEKFMFYSFISDYLSEVNLA